LYDFPIWSKNTVLENRGIEDNEWTQGEENKGRMGGGMHNEGLPYFYYSCSIIRAIKSEGMCSTHRRDDK